MVIRALCSSRACRWVIELRDRELLVSAAAGSGKTATLVQNVLLKSRILMLSAVACGKRQKVLILLPVLLLQNFLHRLAPQQGGAGGLRFLSGNAGRI